LRAAAWAAARITDCIPEAVSGRADPARGGRHQHSLRDLDGCSAGDGSGGPQASAPLIEAPRPPLCDGARGQRLAPPRGAGRHEGDLLPAGTNTDAGLVRDALTGIAVLADDRAAGPRADEVRGIQALAGGVRPGDCDLAGALVRRAGRTADAATLVSVGPALWEITADGDMGETLTHSQAGPKAHGVAASRPLGLAPRALAEACRALVAEVAERAGTAAAALQRPAPRAFWPARGKLLISPPWAPTIRRLGAMGLHRPRGYPRGGALVPTFRTLGPAQAEFRGGDGLYH
jgi:hypothetical protein